PAFSGLGLQVGPARENVLTNSDMSLGTTVPTGYTLGDTGAVVTSSTLVNSGLGESTRASRHLIENSTGSSQTVTLHHASSGSSGEWWNAQARVRINDISGAVVVELKVRDETSTEEEAVSVDT